MMRRYNPMLVNFRQKGLLDVLVITCLMATASLLANPVIEKKKTTKADPTNAKQVKRGELVYRKFCSLCHGVNLKGQADWRHRKADGKLPAPPHDETGHTWHHPDDILFGITKHGLVPPYAPANYKSDMSAWGTTLKDDDIWAVLAFIKSRWPAQQLEFQQKVNQQ